MYTVTIRDTDGSTKRTYKTKGAALKRFEEMLGYPIANAVEEMFTEEPDNYPDWTAMPYVRGVSNFGCVVSIERTTDEA
jgi:hypothetical protein